MARIKIYYIYRGEKLVTEFTGSLKQARQYAKDQNMTIGDNPVKTLAKGET